MKSPRLSIRKRSAFTLIELLAVIAIIGILSAIIIPVVGRVRENARSAQCTSNQRQIAAAALLYASENKGHIPAVYTTNGSLVDSWVHLLWPYAGYSRESLTAIRPDGRNHFSSAPNNTPEPNNIFVCPSTRTMKDGTPGYRNIVPNANVLSYGLNSIHPDGTSNPGPWLRPTRIASVASPSKTSLVCESSFLLGDHGGYRSYFGMLPHQGAANFAFFDGHVQRLASANIPDVATAAGRTFWQGR